MVLAEQMKKWRKSSKEKGYTLDIDQMQKRLKFQDGVLMEQSKLIEALRQENALLKQQSSLQRRQSSIFQLAQDKKPILEIKEKKERKESMHIEIKNPSCDNKPQMMFFSRSRDNANKEKMQNIQHSPNNLSTADKLTNKL